MFEPQELEQVQFIEPDELRQWLSQENAPRLIDVRSFEDHKNTPIDWLSSQHENIPLDQLTDQINLWDPDEPIVFYCNVGQKSFNAATAFIQADFSSVYSLQGGMTAWQLFSNQGV